VKSLLNNLPLGFLTALRALVELLYKIDRNSVVNLMSMTNLAIVFSPTLLRARDETVAKIMQDSTAAHGIVLFLLSQAELLAVMIFIAIIIIVI
jgi:energy-converting hydrogenase Eha subunit E